MVKISIRMGLALMSVLGARATGAAGPTWNGQLRVDAVATSNLFPGSANTGPDRGLMAQASGSTRVRLPQGLKLGLEGTLGGVTYARFDEGREGWFGVNTTLRRATTQVVAEGELKPHSIKFPDESDGAAYRRFEWRIGVRQSLPRQVRLRVEGRFQDDDFESAFDVRDAHAHGAYAQLAFPVRAVTLHALGEIERTDARADRYDHEDHSAGASADWSGAAWRLEGGFRSGVRTYRHAIPGESNYGRRDQWIEGTVKIGRELMKGVTLYLEGTALEQTSSRPDRAFATQSSRLGLEWTPGSTE